jgi:hypothetical protein
MRKAIGFLIVLWGLSQYFSSAMFELDSAAAKSFSTIGVAAEVTSLRLKER